VARTNPLEAYSREAAQAYEQWKRSLASDPKVLTAELSAPSARKLDTGREPIEASPLFGGPQQESLF
jgi:hypothetical protein